MSGRARILIPEYREPRALLESLLAPVGEIFGERGRVYSEPEFAEALAEADAVVVTSREKVTEGALRRASRLKLIAKTGVGVENIDIPAATRRGVPVVNTPGANAIAVAEHTLALLLSVARRVPQS
ncbi:MAG: phosphoglycerate dehydrogenase, partial [Nitrospinota bacterium]